LRPMRRDTICPDCGADAEWGDVCERCERALDLINCHKAGGVINQDEAQAVVAWWLIKESYDPDPRTKGTYPPVKGCIKEITKATGLGPTRVQRVLLDLHAKGAIRYEAKPGVGFTVTLLKGVLA
jgi:hypothetical protein